MLDVTAVLKAWRAGAWQGRFGGGPITPPCGVWWIAGGSLHVSAELDERGRWKADLQRDAEYVTSGFGDTIGEAVLAMIDQDAFGRSAAYARSKGGADVVADDANDTTGALRGAHLRPAVDVAADVRVAATDTEQEAARAFQEQFEDALTRRGDKTKLHLHVQDRFLGVARRMLDDAGYAYEVLTKGGLGQLRDGGTTTPVIINLIAPRGA